MRWLLPCFLMLSGLAAVAADPTRNRLEIYTLGFAELQPAAEAVRALAGPEGHVTLDEAGRRLFVITSPDRHAQIADALRKIDIAPRNVRIDVDIRRAGRTDESEVSVDGGGEVVRQDGVTHGTIRITPRIIDQTKTDRTQVRQSLLVASGRDAKLRVGEHVPYLGWLLEYGRMHGAVLQPEIQWQDVGSFLVVQPTVVGEGPTIRLRLTPELTGWVEGRSLETRFASVSTEVVVQDGQPFQIGGLDQDHDFYSRFLIGGSQSGSRDELSITLTPHIMPSGGDVP